MAIGTQSTISKTWRAAATASAGTMLLIAGCGSATLGAQSGATGGAPTSSGPAISSPAIPCSQVSALRTSLQDLIHTKVSPASAGRIAADLTAIKAQLTMLSGQVGPALAAQDKPLSRALKVVENDANALAAHPTAAQAAMLTQAVNHLKATARPLLEKMAAICPSS